MFKGSLKQLTPPGDSEDVVDSSTRRSLRTYLFTPDDVYKYVLQALCSNYQFVYDFK
jgi:hypothetical protein